MRIDCPNCATRYVVPDEFVVPGRVMRCSRCATQWAPPVGEAAVEPTPPPLLPSPEPMAASEPPPAPLPEPDEPPVPVVPRGGGGPALTIAWLASAALLMGLGWAVATHRGAIEGAWPASARLFAWLRPQ